MNGIHQLPRGTCHIGLAGWAIILICWGFLSNSGSVAAPAVDRAAVDDFSLLDQHGRYHQLYRQRGARAVVLMIAGNGCPIVRRNLPKFQALRQKYPKTRFWLLNANRQDDLPSILAEANEFEVTLPILKDDTQLVARSLGVKRTAEVIAISTQDWTVFYRGALDDQMEQGAVRAKVGEEYLANALRSYLEGGDVAVPSILAAGCQVHYDWALNVPEAELSYARHVAPILERRCVSCHSPGNIGPFALSSYSKVRGFSAQIREEVLTRRMPPWSADPHYGTFREDRSLSVAETQTLVRWIDAGMPREEGDDPLERTSQSRQRAQDWPLGPPDYVVAPSHIMNIPATGVMDYITNIVENPLPTDAWLKGVVVHPDNAKVLHHLIVYLEYPEGHPRAGRWEETWLVGWAPGATHAFYPEGTGKLLPKDCKLRFQLHYTPYGKETTDLSKLGLYLHAQRPRTELQMRGVANLDFSIAPGASDAQTLAILDFSRDTLVYELSPHMHKRGSWFRYEALYPNGKYELLLSVPRYNFNWQHTYRLAEPKRIPARTRILCTGGFDNSKYNPDNPDPKKTVRWGDQSTDEMFIGFMTVSDPPPVGGKPPAGSRDTAALR